MFFKNNSKRSFWIKILHNELSTLDVLVTRRPDLYANFKKYTLCLEEEENRLHLFSCSKLTNIIEEIWKTTMEYFKKEILLLYQDHNKKEDKDFQSQNLLKEINNTLDYLKLTIFNTYNSLLNFTLGLFNKDLTKKIITFLPKNCTSTTKIRDLLTRTSNHFRNLFRSKVWNFRCESINEADHTRGLTKKIKKNKPPINTNLNKLTNSNNTKSTNDNTSNKKENNIKPIKFIESEIYDWIKYDRKWLNTP